MRTVHTKLTIYKKLLFDYELHYAQRRSVFSRYDIKPHRSIVNWGDRTASPANRTIPFSHFVSMSLALDLAVNIIAIFWLYRHIQMIRNPRSKGKVVDFIVWANLFSQTRKSIILRSHNFWVRSVLALVKSSIKGKLLCFIVWFHYVLVYKRYVDYLIDTINYFVLDIQSILQTTTWYTRMYILMFATVTLPSAYGPRRRVVMHFIKLNCLYNRLSNSTLVAGFSCAEISTMWNIVCCFLCPKIRVCARWSVVFWIYLNSVIARVHVLVATWHVKTFFIYLKVSIPVFAYRIRFNE